MFLFKQIYLMTHCGRAAALKTPCQKIRVVSRCSHPGALNREGRRKKEERKVLRPAVFYKTQVAKILLLAGTLKTNYFFFFFFG